MEPLDILIDEISNKSKNKPDIVLDMVDKKYSEMNGLITKEGAAHLVAKELEIDLIDQPYNKTFIKSIKSGMRNISVIGRIFKISKLNEFKRSDGTTGKVINLFVGDSTGYIRLPLWDEQISFVENQTINLGDVIQISNAISRENIYGDIEISLGRFGNINHIDSSNIPSIEDLSKMYFNIVPERTTINNLVTSGNFEINGNIGIVIKGNFLFEVCSICGSRFKNGACSVHGDATPNNELVISFLVDDGTGDLRCTVFRNNAEKLCDISPPALAQFEPDKRYEVIKNKILGKEITLIGNVKKNKFFDSLEMIVTDFKDINALEESKRLVGELNFMVGS